MSEYSDKSYLLVVFHLSSFLTFITVIFTISLFNTSAGNKASKKSTVPTSKQSEERPQSKIVWEQSESIPAKKHTTHFNQVTGP